MDLEGGQVDSGVALGEEIVLGMESVVVLIMEPATASLMESVEEDLDVAGVVVVIKGEETSNQELDFIFSCHTSINRVVITLWSDLPQPFFDYFWFYHQYLIMF